MTSFSYSRGRMVPWLGTSLVCWVASSLFLLAIQPYAEASSRDLSSAKASAVKASEPGKSSQVSPLDEPAQATIVEGIAKDTRRSMRRLGYQNVTTTPVARVSRVELNGHYASSAQHERPLSADDYSKLYSCLNSQECHLWGFVVHSSYRGGSGSSQYFVRINELTGAHDVVQHLVYAE